MKSRITDPVYSFRQALSLFIFCLLLLPSAVSLADDKNNKIKPPFGILNVDTGPAANFTLKDLDGETFELASTKGHWVFLHFWASWCGPCRKEMPSIQKLANALEDEDFQIVMINTAEDADTIFTFLAEINVDLDSLMDTDGQVTESWQPRGLPATFLINPEGKVRFQAIGGREWNQPEYVNFLMQLSELSAR
jgi:thiol-disulfide isomerase/thioredoxin